MSANRFHETQQIQRVRTAPKGLTVYAQPDLMELGKAWTQRHLPAGSILVSGATSKLFSCKNSSSIFMTHCPMCINGTTLQLPADMCMMQACRGACRPEDGHPDLCQGQSAFLCAHAAM